MAVRVEETYEAHTRKINAKGAVTAAEIIYLVFEAENEDAALAAVLNVAPQVQGNVPLNSIEIDSRETETTFKVKAVYEDEDSGSGGSSDDDDDESEPTLSFDCGGGTKRVMYSLEQRQVLGEEKPAGGAVGWNGETGDKMEVSGVEVPAAQLQETYTKEMRYDDLSTSYRRRIAGLVGKVNSQSFKGWEAGEVIFRGASFAGPTSRSSEKITVSFHFAIQLNEPEAKLNGETISGGKKGWEYLWAIFKTVKDSIPRVQVSAAYVDKVCEEADFSILGL